jgi:hypothetical protein
MKTKLILLFCIAAMSSFAQLNLINVGTNSNDGSGEVIGRNTWLKINANDVWLANQLGVNFTNCLTVATNGANAAYVQTSGLNALFLTNGYPFSSSNYFGRFTNVWQFNVSGSLTGTNKSFTNYMSGDGTTWVPFAQTNLATTYLFTNYLTNTFGSNIVVIYTNIYTNFTYTGVYLSSLGSTATGSVSIYSLASPQLNGKLNQFKAQSFEFEKMQIVPAIITNSGSSTFGFGAGLIGVDTNYIYISVGLNAWRRIAIPTNTW